MILSENKKRKRDDFSYNQDLTILTALKQAINSDDI